MSKNKSFRKYAATTMAVAVAASAVAPVVAGAEESKFTDVNKDTDHYKAINAMTEAGIIKGFPDGSFKPYAEVTRQQVAAMLTKALDLDIPENIDAVLSIYDDVNEDSDGAGVIAAVTAANVFKGNSGKFNPGGNITREQMASVLVKAYDLDEIEADEANINLANVSVSHKDRVQVLANLGITKATNDFRPAEDLTRGQFSTFLQKTIETVEEANRVEEVQEITAINASELKVTFSTEVDKDTAENPENYEIKINDKEDAEILDIQLSKDGKTAIILLDQENNEKSAFQNGDKYVVQTNDKIKAVSGTQLEKFVSEEQTFDETAAPSLIKTKLDGDNLVFTFDRPVNANRDGQNDVQLVKVDGIEIDNNDLKAVEAKEGSNGNILGKAGAYEYKIEIQDDKALDQAKQLGEHEVVIFDIYDTASEYPSKASVTTGTYTITDEVTAPEVVGIEAVNANRIFVETNTNVELNDDSVVTVSKGGHEFPESEDNFDDSVTTKEDEAISAATTGTYDGRPGIWVVVTDSKASKDENPLYRAGEESVNLTVTVEKYQANGLIGKKSTQNVTVNKNNNKPVVDSTVLKDKKDLVIKFTDDLDSGVNNLEEGKDFVVRNNDGVIIEGFDNVSSQNKELTITGAGELKDAPYTVEFKANKFKNEENDESVTEYLVNTVKNDEIIVTVGEEVESSFKYTEFKFEDEAETSADDVEASGQYFVDVPNNTITFKYPEKMGDSARTAANYTLDGKALPSGTTVDFLGDRETVRIVLPKDTFKTSTKYKLGITTNVKTESGSMIVGSLQTKAPAELVFDVQDNVKPELVSAMYVGDVFPSEVTNETKTDTIEVTFNEAIVIDGNNPAEDFYVEVQGSRIGVEDVEVVDQDNIQHSDRKLVLTLAQEINVKQTATITIVPEEELEDDEAETAIKDTAGNKALGGSSTKATKYEFREYTP